MLKTCWFDKDGNLINIGPWDYRIERVEVEPPEYDPNTGDLIREGVYEDRVTNPLPEGAYTAEIEIVEGPDGGLYPAGYTPPETPQQKIARLEAELAASREENLTIMEAVAEIYEMVVSQGGGGT